jgi:hypothetical protein
MSNGFDPDFDLNSVPRVVRDGIKSNNEKWRKAAEEYMAEREQRMKDEIVRLQAKCDELRMEALRDAPMSKIDSHMLCPSWEYCNEEIQATRMP